MTQKACGFLGFQIEIRIMQLSPVIFYLIAALTVGSAAIVAFSRNIVYSAFSLLGTFGGVAGIYVFLGADFVAGVQVLIYVGGILVLILFAVMLSSRISEIRISNQSVGRVPGFFITICFGAILIYVAVSGQWPVTEKVDFSPTTASIGNALLGKWLLPFEVVSILILSGLMGAVVIARRKRMPKGDEK